MKRKAFLFFISLLITAHTQAQNISEGTLANKLKIPQSFVNVANKFQIDPVMMYAIATTESGINRGFYHGKTPYAWTANICDMAAGNNCKGYWFDSREELYHRLQQELNRGNDWFDVGIMQVNWHFHKHRFDNDLWLATHPLINMNKAAQLIVEIQKKYTDYQDIYSAYHAGIGFKNKKYSPKRQAQIASYAQQTNITYQKVISHVKN